MSQRNICRFHTGQLLFRCYLGKVSSQFLSVADLSVSALRSAEQSWRESEEDLWKDRKRNKQTGKICAFKDTAGIQMQLVLNTHFSVPWVQEQTPVNLCSCMSWKAKSSPVFAVWYLWKPIHRVWMPNYRHLPQEGKGRALSKGLKRAGTQFLYSQCKHSDGS